MAARSGHRLVALFPQERVAIRERQTCALHLRDGRADCLPYPTGYNRGMAKRIDPDEYIRIGSAAAIAGVTRAYINRLIAQGRFPAVCIDGQNFVRRADAEKFANPPKN